MQYEFRAPTLQEAIKLATQDLSNKNTDDCGELLREIIRTQGNVSDALRVVESISEDTKRSIEGIQKEALDAGILLMFEPIAILTGIRGLLAAVGGVRNAMGFGAAAATIDFTSSTSSLISAIDGVLSYLETLRDYTSISQMRRKYGIAQFQIKRGRKRLESLQERYQKAGCYVSP